MVIDKTIIESKPTVENLRLTPDSKMSFLPQIKAETEKATAGENLGAPSLAGDAFS